MFEVILGRNFVELDFFSIMLFKINFLRLIKVQYIDVWRVKKFIMFNIRMIVILGRNFVGLDFFSIVLLY